MSRENVEPLREWFEAWNRAPSGSPKRSELLRRGARAAFEAWNRGDFELVPHVDDPGVQTFVTAGSGVAVGIDRVYYGPEGHCEAMATWNEAWRNWTADIQDVIDDRHDQVVVVARVHCEGTASGIRLDEWTAVRYTFRQGRILRVDAAFDPMRDRVLEAVGLAE
jgi:hypothetical protein